MGYHCCCCCKNSPSVERGSPCRSEDVEIGNYLLLHSTKMQQEEQPPPSPGVDAAAASSVAVEETPPRILSTSENEATDTILCSSTTTESLIRQRTIHHRMETAASSTWPDVSMPTTSVRYDHLRTLSDNDTEDEFSSVERSTSTLRERRSLCRARERERERVVVREIIMTERERRHDIVEFFNNARRIIAIRHYKGILNMERREILVEYFKERYALLLCVVKAEESMARRLIELEGQAELLGRMQQHRLDRRKNSPLSHLALAPCPGDDSVPPAARMSVAGRSLSAPPPSWRPSEHSHESPLLQRSCPTIDKKSAKGFIVSVMCELPQNESTNHM